MITRLNYSWPVHFWDLLYNSQDGTSYMVNLRFEKCQVLSGSFLSQGIDIVGVDLQVLPLIGAELPELILQGTAHVEGEIC